MSEHQYVTIEKGPVYKPLYPPEGGPLAGFVCCECKEVTKTKHGMLRHLAVCHGIRIQAALPFDEPKKIEGETGN